MSIIKNAVKDIGTFYTCDSFLELKGLQLDLKSKLGTKVVPNDPTPIYSNGEYTYQLFTLERGEEEPKATFYDFNIERLDYRTFKVILHVDEDHRANLLRNSIFSKTMNKLFMPFGGTTNNSEVYFRGCKQAVEEVIDKLSEINLIYHDIYEMMIHELETLAHLPININCANSSLNTPRKLYLLNAEFPFKELLEQVTKTLGLTEPMKEFKSGTFYEYGLKLNVAEYEYLQRYLLDSYLTVNINV